MSEPIIKLVVESRPKPVCRATDVVELAEDAIAAAETESSETPITKSN